MRVSGIFSIRKSATVVMAFIAVSAGIVAGAVAMERQVRPEHRENIDLTIYNQDLALIRDVRQVSLHRGVNELAFIDVSQRLRAETVMFKVRSEETEIDLFEQNFHYDALTAQKLLEKSLGRTVRIARINSATGEETIEEAQVLSVDNGVLLRIGDRIEAIGLGERHDFPGRIIFDRLPENLRPQPTLVVVFESENAVEGLVELSYLSRGMSWQADYVAMLTSDERHLSLQGWATIVNQSGTDYDDASIRLVAGDINQAQDNFSGPVMARMMTEADAGNGTAPTGLGDYHLYTLPRATGIENNQTKQVALLERIGIPVNKEYRVNGGAHFYMNRLVSQLSEPQSVSVALEFENLRKPGVSSPLPAGVIRVYAESRSHGTQFIGEDRIGHTPESQEVRLRLGRAFDVTVERRQTDYEDSGRGENRLWVYETSHEIILKNAKQHPVEVIVDEQIPGDWTIVKESAPHSKTDAATATWTITVPAEGEAKLVYTARVEIVR